MKLWILENVDPYLGDVSEQVIRAANEKNARSVAAENCGKEGKGVWFDPTLSFCKLITEKGEEECLLVSIWA
ncbi:MAG: hypothetical protein UT24_C0015G0031 [Candidatus Woesebacteria bacterium GW2011_GWB1_39_12]|uniref:Uncharacterized protein n=1 Tax=Candidatus Woesebacteria bacterium GW2011_GWB1_39_12 TaxID=1618574 RepID=A0A0G0MAK9_9BACT|nr:MAG: hypothetical protein UT24_C0015G0031 [Candidatus Woesebacteria bacterium GW2011_GWB1_39_12]